MLVSSAYNRDGLETTVSFKTEFQNSEQLVLNSVSSRTDSLIDRVLIGNLGFLIGPSGLGLPIQVDSKILILSNGFLIFLVATKTE